MSTTRASHQVGTVGYCKIKFAHPTSAFQDLAAIDRKEGRFYGTISGTDKLPCAKGVKRDVFLLKDCYFMRAPVLEGSEPTRIDLVSLDAQRHDIYIAKGSFTVKPTPKAPRVVRPPRELTNIEQNTVGRIEVDPSVMVHERVQLLSERPARILQEPAPDTSAPRVEEPGRSTAEESTLGASASSDGAPEYVQLLTPSLHQVQL